KILETHDLEISAANRQLVLPDFPRRNPLVMIRQILLSLFIFIVVPVFAEAPRPNIVLVMSDDQGWGQTSYNGHPHLKTPNLDAMAENGLRFNRFYAAASTCTPTRASVMTGRLPGRTGAGGIGAPLNSQEKTIAQALKKAGYRTAHFGKWHLNGVSGNGMPVLEEDRLHPGSFGFDTWLSVTNYFDLDPLMGRNGETEWIEGESSEIIVSEALKFVAEQPKERFFAVIWYGSPHFPFQASDEDVAPFLAQGLEGKHADQLGEIVALDRSVGMLRQGLRDLGVAEDTLIWFCGDNGGLKEDPDSVGILQGHKGSLYEGGIRVPGIIEWPAAVEPAITDFPASTMDIMPTLVDLLELPNDSQLGVVDGESIRQLLNGEEPKRTHGIPFLAKGSALIQGKYKLRNLGIERNPEWGLYDLEADPEEAANVVAKYPERVSQMVAELEEFKGSMEESKLGKDYPEGKIVGVESGGKAFWSELPEYQKRYDTFEKLKPGWQRPTPRAEKLKAREERKRKKTEEQK
ncbi:MAG: sulfatase-like hydrolase/transferase, partial [Verrucomicrobiota bacterium]